MTKRRTRKHKLTPSKAREILRHGSVKGKRLTKKQKRFFGLIAGGGTPTRTGRRSSARRKRVSRKRK